MTCPHKITLQLSLLTMLVLGFAATTLSEETPTSQIATAAEFENWSLVDKLIQANESIDAAQVDGMTALHWAVYHQHERTVRKLIESKANVNLATRYNVVPLMIACSSGNHLIVELLLKSGANPDITSPEKETPLMVAARTGNALTISSLLKHGAKVDARERRGQTALMWAAAEGHVEAVDALLKAGADINATTKSGFTAMLFAAREGRLNVVQQLVQSGVDINSMINSKNSAERAPRDGTSALILAVESGHFEVALWLVKHGADPNDQRSGYSPLHIMSWVRKPDRGENENGDPSPRGSGMLTDLQFVEAIVAAGADINLQLNEGKGGKAVLNHKGATPFLLAAKTADLAFLQLLVKLGADPNIPNSEGCTPLMAAAGVGVRAVGEEAGTEPEVLETLVFLVEHAADVNAVDENKETAMHGAAYRNFPLVVTFLSEHGADAEVWNHKNNSGWTPVMIAQGKRPGSFKPSPETVQALETAISNAKESQ